jgi:hypothetical protein
MFAKRAGGTQERIDQRGLAMIDVGNERDATQRKRF